MFCIASRFHANITSVIVIGIVIIIITAVAIIVIAIILVSSHDINLSALASCLL